ncbi:MAG: hypothetical protein K2W85_16735 [Phycisphaerales bacterium]|nr:hypothetical protein [Phycisphaerales bacterium]
MAAQVSKKGGHGAFYLVMGILALGVLGAGYYLWSQNSTDTQREETAEANLPGRKPESVPDKVDDSAPAAAAPEAPPSPGGGRVSPTGN